MIRSFASDRDTISARSLFRRAKKLELSYGARLRKIARHVGDIVTGFDLSRLDGAVLIHAALLRYADALEPYAHAVGSRMVAEVAAADRESWRRSSALVGRLLHKEIETAPTGHTMREALARQVPLIKSLPVEAAERVNRLTTEGLTEGRRAGEIVEDILASGEVTRSRATLIALTEVSRTATELTKARAEHIGSTHFIWRTAEDGSVRHDHRILNGQAFRWDQPPIADQRTGARALPGGIYRCRCYPEPIIADA